MKKQEFLERLRKNLPEADREERLSFYSEMIDDRMEEGLSEEEAVEAVASPENILVDAPPEKAKKEWKTWEILLLAVGSPVWASLLIAAVAVVLSLYVSWWTVIVSLWAVFGSLAACGVAGAVSGAAFIARGYMESGLAMIGAGIVCAGLAIVLFCIARGITRGTVSLTKTLVQRCAAGKEKG